MKSCPHCEAELPDVSDAYCPDCRQELPAPVATASERTAADRPMTPNQAGWVIVAVLQGLLNLLFIGSVLVWLVLSFVERWQSE